MKHGGREACEFELSTHDVCKFLKASNVSGSAKTVQRAMKAKIEGGTSDKYTVLLLGKKEIASGIRVKLLSSVLNGKSIPLKATAPVAKKAVVKKAAPRKHILLGFSRILRERKLRAAAPQKHSLRSLSEILNERKLREQALWHQ